MLRYKSLFHLGIVLVLLAITVILIAQKQDKKDGRPKVNQQKIDAAIRKGIDYLIKNPCPPIKHTDYNKVTRDVRADELILYTLLHSGVPQEDIEKLVEKIISNPLDRLYHVALRAMALDELDRVRYQGQIKDCAQYIIDNQCANGQWSYGEKVDIEKSPPPPPPKKGAITGPNEDSTGPSGTKPKDNYNNTIKKIPIRQHRKGPMVGDNSNAQYAALGLRSCMQAGIEIPRDVLENAAKWWRKAQAKNGGWNYAPAGISTVGDGAAQTPYGAMTVGGIGSLCIYDFYLKQSITTDENIKKAMKWMEDNFTVTEHAKYYDLKHHLYYYLYAMERAGIFASTEFFGNNEWYQLGAEFLLKQQKADGSWVDNSGLPAIDTCFAILFLRRATKPLKAIETQ